MTRQTAEALCAARGASLCSRAQLARRCCKSGCGNDYVFTWSADSCSAAEAAKTGPFFFNPNSAGNWSCPAGLAGAWGHGEPLLFIPQNNIDGVYSTLRGLLPRLAVLRELVHEWGLRFAVVAPTLRYAYQPSGFIQGSREAAFSAMYSLEHLRTWLGVSCVVPEADILTSTEAFVHLHLGGAPIYEGSPTVTPLHARLTLGGSPSLAEANHVRRVNDSRGVPLTFKHARLFGDDFVGSLAHAVAQYGAAQRGAGMAADGAPRRGRVLLIDGVAHNDTYPYPRSFAWDIGPSLAAGGDVNRVPSALRLAAGALRFAPHVRLAAGQLLRAWNLSHTRAAWAAVHLRRGDLYHCTSCATGTDQVVAKVRSATAQLRHCQRSGQALSALVVSVTSHERGKVLSELRAKLPGVRLLGFDERAWGLLRPQALPGWAAHAPTSPELLRDAVEVQVWLHAPVFIGGRSTMSEFNMLHRNPECTLYMAHDTFFRGRHGGPRWH